SSSGPAPATTPATRPGATGMRPSPSSTPPGSSSRRPVPGSRRSSSRSSRPERRDALAVGLVVLGSTTLSIANGEDLADPAPVGRLDGQGQAIDRDLLAGLGDAADAVVDEPADRVVFVSVLEPQVRVEQVGQIVHVGPAVDPGLVVGQPDDERLFLVVLVLDLAHDLLEEVLDGD